jgi:hypothetical protein
MAVVILVLGLLIGTVASGKSILHSARVRAVMKELDTYKQAIAQFQTRYQATPGDFAGASNLWSGIANGDGDGRVVVYGSAVPTPNEQYLVWKHLAKAALIDGEFSGTSGTSTSGKAAGENVPESELTGAGWELFFNNSYDAGGGRTMSFSTTPYNHILMLFEPSEAENVIRAGDGLIIDTKVDDGDARTGNIGQIASSGTNWSSDEDSLTKLVFNTGF